MVFHIHFVGAPITVQILAVMVKIQRFQVFTFSVVIFNFSRTVLFLINPHVLTPVAGFGVYRLTLVVYYIESRRFLIRDSPRPATTYEQKTGGADGVKGA